MACEQIKEVNVLQTFTLFFETRQNGVLADPDTHELFLSGAGFVGVVTVPIVDTSGTGLFSIEVTALAEGILYWVQRASGVAIAPASSQGFVKVLPLPFVIP